MSGFGSRPAFVAMKCAALCLLAFSIFVLSGCGSSSDSAASSQAGPTFQLTVSPPAAGTGTISSSPPGINCPPTCTASFPQNSQVKLTAIPGKSYYFAGWTSGCSGMSGGCNLRLSTRKHVSAVFKRGESLTVAIAGTGSGTILSTPPGINCPSTCSAVFPTNAAVTLTENPATNNMFSSWSGACSGASTCSLTLAVSDTVTATFEGASGGSGTSVIAYIFTPDSALLNTSEFALLSNGDLKAVKSIQTPEYSTFAATAHGVAMVTGVSGMQSTATLQSYALAADGSLKAIGSPQVFSANKFINLASDSTYVYALSDEGLFGYEDQPSGLTPLAPIQLTPQPPYPCTLAQENANSCWYGASLTLSNSNALLVQSSYVGAGSSSYVLNTFDRSEGELADQGPRWSWYYTVPVPTPDGRFAYGFDPFVSLRLFRLDLPGNGTPMWNILYDGQQISDGFAQVLISNDGSFLYAIVSDGSESPRVRVFRIDSTSGDLTEVPGSPFLTGQYYFSSAVIDPGGHFMLLIDAPCMGSSGPCTQAAALVSMSIDSTTGAMSVISNVRDGQMPTGIFAAPISH
jgi:hypothetical protein